MNFNDKITLTIGLVFLGFILSTCMGCATGGGYNRPIDWSPMQNLSNQWGYGQKPKQTRCTSQYNSTYQTTETVCE